MADGAIEACRTWKIVRRAVMQREQLVMEGFGDSGCSEVKSRCLSAELGIPAESNSSNRNEAISICHLRLACRTPCPPFSNKAVGLMQFTRSWHIEYKPAASYVSL